MPTDIQLLKAYGHLPTVELKDLEKDSVGLLVTQGMRESLRQRNCGHPDAYDVEIAVFDGIDVGKSLGIDSYEAEYLARCHQRMAPRLFAPYNNSRFPADCHPEHKGVHAVKVFVDWDTFPRVNMRPCIEQEFQQLIKAGVWRIPGSKKLMDMEYMHDSFDNMPMAKVAMWFADEAYRLLGVKHVHVDDAAQKRSEDQIHIICKRIPGGTEGIGWFTNGTCGDHVFTHIDSTRKTLGWMLRLLTHELGHNHGEPHQFKRQEWHMSVMSYTRPPGGLNYGFSTGEAPHVIPRDASIDSLIEKYGGIPVGDEPEPDPKPTTGGSDWAIVNGAFYSVKPVATNERIQADGIISLGNKLYTMD